MTPSRVDSAFKALVDDLEYHLGQEFDEYERWVEIIREVFTVLNRPEHSYALLVLAESDIDVRDLHA